MEFATAKSCKLNDNQLVKQNKIKLIYFFVGELDKKKYKLSLHVL